MAEVGRLVLDGNSLTSGTGATNSELTGYPPVLRTLLQASQASHPNRLWSVMQVGVSGHSATQRIAAFETDVMPLYNGRLLNVLVFFEVINDAATLNSDQCIANLMAYTTQARKRGWRVVHCVNPACGRSDIQTQLRDVAHWIRGATDWSDYQAVDLQSDSRLTNLADSTYFNDNTHLTDAGYAVLASLVHARILQIG